MKIWLEEKQFLLLSIGQRRFWTVEEELGLIW
jgi:hypothetical protein